MFEDFVLFLIWDGVRVIRISPTSVRRQTLQNFRFMKSLSHVRLFATLWTVAGQAPLSMGFSRQEYWSVLPFSFPGDLPYPGSKSVSLKSPALAHRFFTISTTWEALTDIEGGRRRG